MRKQQRAGGTVGCFFSSRRCSRTLCARSSSLTRGVTCCGKHDPFATLASLDPKRVPSRDLHKARLPMSCTSDICRQAWMHLGVITVSCLQA